MVLTEVTCRGGGRGWQHRSWTSGGKLGSWLSWGVVLFLASLPARAALNVAITDYQDSFTGVKGLGLLLTDMGQAYTDVTASGTALNLAGYDTFIIGSFTTRQTNVASALASSSSAMSITLRNFVNSGGTVIVLTQADQDLANEAWVQSPVVVTRVDPDFDSIKRIQTGHQVFSTPNAIVDANLQGWTVSNAANSSTWPGSWESISVFNQVGVLAGNDATAPTYATIVEAGWGAGRAIFVAMGPDKAFLKGNAQAKTQGKRLMQNLLQYASDVKAGTAAPIEIYQNPNGGWHNVITGHVFNDSNGNGTKDPGEPGIGGVGVSDSIDLVQTAADGSYTLPNTFANANLLYVCLPAGYAKSGQWWRKINSNSTPAVFEFGLKASDENADFDFVQVTDIHVGGSGNKPLLIAALAQVASLKKTPAFVIATGDLADSGANLTMYEDYSAGIATSQVPYFNVFGNHDVNSSTNTNYRSYLGPDWYSFDYGNCHFLIVNSVIKPATQAAWIAKDLQMLKGNKRLFIFQHYSPTQAEYDEFNSYGTELVFSGHWHSQHTVKAGNITSFNSETFLFGGIDCSPAGFKILHVGANGGVSSQPRWLADGKRLRIVSPNGSLMVARGDLSIVANAYETASLIQSASYQLKSGGNLVAQGSLTSEGDWSWVGTVAGNLLPRGSYDLTVTVVNDKGEQNTAQTSFMTLATFARAPAPAGDWTQFGGGPQRGGVAPNSLDPQLGMAWRHFTGGSMDFGSPVLKSQSIYVGVKDRHDFEHNGVIALDAKSGAQKWFRPTPAAVSHSVAVDDTRVYACSHGGILHALDRATGNEIWNKSLGSDSLRFQYAGPLLAGGNIYAGTYAYFGSFLPDGTKNWNQTYGGDWISCNSCPALKGTTLVVPADWETNSLSGVNTATGLPIWQYTVHGLHGSPVITADDKVVFTDYDGSLHCITLAGGTDVWPAVALGGGRSGSTPAISGNTIVTGGTGSIRAYNLSTGGLLWAVPIATSPLKMAPYSNQFDALVGSATIAGSMAYVPCGDGKLYALALNNGQVLWSLDFGTPLLSAPCISGNAMYITAYDGSVYALVSGSGAAFAAADFDKDADVDMEDFGHIQACMTPTGMVSVEPGCQDANLNGDSVVNSQDITLFVNCFGGPNRPPNPQCTGAP